MQFERIVHAARSYGARALVASVTALATSAWGSGLVILHSFSGGDGYYPEGPLTLDAQGNLYGTASTGGPGGNGTLFRIGPAGDFSILYAFDGGTGGAPTGSLLLDADGALWGTTNYAGSPYDGGTVYRRDPSGQLRYTGVGHGAGSVAGLTVGPDGMFYGTTIAGGAKNVGTVFRFDPVAFESVTIHSFDGHDGDGPRGKLLSSGDVLYGTTWHGGHQDRGTVFSLNLDGSGFVAKRTKRGAWFFCGLTLDAQGRAWGKIAADKATSHTSAQGTGGIFRIDEDGRHTVAHRFAPDGSEGEGGNGELMLASDGWLYGVTGFGGTHFTGSLFRINPDDDTFEVLYSFGDIGTGDGQNPSAALIQDASHSFYGTTLQGGQYGIGTVFRFDP